MPLNPNALERLLLFRLNRGPAPMLDLFGAAAFEAATLADRMGVFDALAEGPRSAADLAAELNADPEGMAALLGLLAPQGYVGEVGDAYRNSAMTERWVVDEGASARGCASGTNSSSRFWRTTWSGPCGRANPRRPSTSGWATTTARGGLPNWGSGPPRG